MKCTLFTKYVLQLFWPRKISQLSESFNKTNYVSRKRVQRGTKQSSQRVYVQDMSKKVTAGRQILCLTVKGIDLPRRQEDFNHNNKLYSNKAEKFKIF